MKPKWNKIFLFVYCHLFWAVISGNETNELLDNKQNQSPEDVFACVLNNNNYNKNDRPPLTNNYFFINVSLHANDISRNAEV